MASQPAFTCAVWAEEAKDFADCDVQCHVPKRLLLALIVEPTSVSGIEPPCTARPCSPLERRIGPASAASPCIAR